MITLCVALLLAIQAGALQGSAPTALVAGRVVDAATGHGVSTAIVSISSAAGGRGTTPDRVLTDNDGRYFFDHLAKGTYSLTVSKPGWVGGAFGKRRPDGDATSLEIAEGATRADVDIAIWRFAAIEGTVIDESGEPVVDVPVRAIRRQIVAGRPRFAVAALARTDDRGWYRIPSLSPGEYLVALLASTTNEPAGFADATRSRSDAGPAAYFQTMAAIGVAPLVILRGGGVHARDGSLVSSTTALASAPGNTTWSTYATTFYPAASGPGEAGLLRLDSGQERVGVDLQARLARTFRVSGTVADADGLAAFHAVHLVPAEGAEFPLFDAGIAVTNGAGAFTFYGVAAGEYEVRIVRIPAAPPGYTLTVLNGANESQRIGLVTRQPSSALPPSERVWWASQHVIVNDRAVGGVTLTLRAGPRVHGRAEFDGAAPRPSQEQMTSTRVTLESVSGAGPELAVMPAAGLFASDGQFTAESQPPGEYFVRVSHPPPGWSVKSVTADGRDVQDQPKPSRNGSITTKNFFVDGAAR